MKKLLVALLLGCVTLMSTAFTVSAKAVAEVESRSQGNWAQGSSSKNLEARVAELEKKLSGNGLQLLEQVQALQQEVQTLRGLIEEQQHAFESLTRQQRVDKDNSLKNTKPQNSAPVSENNENTFSEFAPPPLESVQSIGPAAAIATTPVEVEKQLYEEAYGLLQSRQYQPAVDQLQALLKRFPDGQYALNAQYWIGEVFLVQGKIDLAETAFQQIVTKYPSHTKTGDALLKLGYVAYAKGDYPKARDFFTQVKTRYASTPTARLAEARLQRMKQDGQI
jgi:tol-pal system protein YbgF